jgi:hypothetical protein
MHRKRKPRHVKGLHGRSQVHSAPDSIIERIAKDITACRGKQSLLQRGF